MEKFSQYRDRATGIAPFLPVTTTLSTVSAAYHGLIFALRLPFFLTFAVGYFAFFHHLPLPVIARKVALWCLLGIPGIWWVDLQLDGVKRGTLADQPRHRFPHGGTVIAANFTSPVDVVYLAAIFDPIFTVSYPGTRKVRRVGLFAAVLAALAPPSTHRPADSELVSLRDLVQRYPDRPIAVFPECTTTNGKAILPLSPGLLACPADVQIFPVSLRYTPADVTTPVPGRWISFLWNLLSRPTTCIRVRIAEGQSNTSATSTNGASVNGELRSRAGDAGGDVSPEEQRVLDGIAEALSRLGRVKRVGLTVEDKAAFVKALNRKRS
ncbi:acyltransferase-like protein [Beauveria bassiana ARSEF 2860]|uniref:Acyltransferase-like protein n=1 Tax=Beauveria bassiana (strain ARSEF 2860) TaxID=655819 RepID=J5JFC7_BEAB2|nr:acyltransferase-like protein [Beauveria bassiana ARSEF 2860]EJP62336.1 acyltransferase-like protein [Beauveria bassiana ARSEF 2860]